MKRKTTEIQENLRLTGFSIKLNQIDLGRLKAIQELSGNNRSEVIRWLINNKQSIIVDTRKIMSALDAIGIALSNSSCTLKLCLNGLNEMDTADDRLSKKIGELTQAAQANLARTGECAQIFRQLMRAL
ncbi:MAG: hypothetical protein ACTJHT_14415 [Sphingobacterium sp.]|uniref:hypothetical protein n=1 Tax=Sphingobacterium sp. JB170 TaxID=1434842 RepID=UPI00097EC550|nr:hypothetical protein [Sphingobacterium sp. JB170]SJN47931.1 hypothetical protein FM107_16470 [Sphingobacterium sp. JB170]